MTTEITIPAASIEAGNRVLNRYLVGGYTQSDVDTVARAAFRAMIEAWPGASRESDQLGGNWHRIILPLTENPND